MNSHHNHQIKSMTLSTQVLERIDAARGENSLTWFLLTAASVLSSTITYYALAGSTKEDQDTRDNAVQQAATVNTLRLVIDGTLAPVDETRPVWSGAALQPRSVPLPPPVAQMVEMSRGDLTVSKFLALAAAALAEAVLAYAIDEDGTFSAHRRDLALVHAKHHQIRIHLDGGAA